MVETGRRRQIEDVASEMFRDQGYAATGVREIARALDIQGASLYAHVTSKEAVLWAIVERAASMFESAADRSMEATTGRSTRAGAAARAGRRPCGGRHRRARSGDRVRP